MLPHGKWLPGKKLLIGDNLSSHISSEVISLCKDNETKLPVFRPTAQTKCSPWMLARLRRTGGLSFVPKRTRIRLPNCSRRACFQKCWRSCMTFWILLHCCPKLFKVQADSTEPCQGDQEDSLHIQVSRDHTRCRSGPPQDAGDSEVWGLTKKQA
jgi:hypothetical protein